MRDMDKPLDFQSIIMALQKYWADQGCLIWQPYYSQVGAGTYNPATFLRVLGPEPWRVAYVEPSIRPDDGRYGENPNRMQMHYQFQVILKPDPGNPIELYLRSLEALGIDARQHDIRFVEDNWESPALGAWGLGWEVWLDGQEITQYTYFQQSGGQILDPVSVEITYGLERIAIALQNVNSFRDIQWSPSRTDGDVNLQAEQEHSKYYFEIADIERLRKMYELYEAEANACLASGLVLPAHDYVLKCSHTFNVLDTRGVVGVTERQALFGRMRDLSRRVSEAYLEQRQRLEYPWLDDDHPQSASTDVKKSTVQPMSGSNASADLLLEIGTEELPAGDLDAALDQLRGRLPMLLKELRLEYDALQVLGTPRRLIIAVQALSARQPDLEQIVKGPPAERAFDATGQPTPAAQGFARSKGVPVEALEVREIEGGRYVTALVHQVGKPTPTVLKDLLPGLIAGLKFDKSMRWNSSNATFSRPIRWILALYGGQVVPFEFAGLQAGNTTFGLRNVEPQELAVSDSHTYFTALEAQGILLDPAERKQRVRQQVDRMAAEVGGSIPHDPGLLAEVTNLVEAPTALRGTFDASYLDLPREVLVSVMKKHQRYFPIEQNGRLLPYFIAVRNGDERWLERVTEGNEHVIRARFADAAYFIREDVRQPLAAYLPRLEKLTFQLKLGSMLDKTRRIQALVQDFLPAFNLDETGVKTTLRAAELCKADLATQMVVEMTSLQGVMGRDYALGSGEPKEVADALFEHYLPRYTGDHLPLGKPGLIVGIADRVDTLVGLFAVGLAPTGNKDPFAQRRAALGLVQNLIAWDLDLDLRPLLQATAGHQPVDVNPQSLVAVQEFIVERLRNILLEQGSRYDAVDAVLAAQGHNPARAARAVQELGLWVERPDWSAILPTYARCVRITRDLKERFAVETRHFNMPAEVTLYESLQKAEAYPRREGSVDDFLNAFVPMMVQINQFFDEVLVMDENQEWRKNRLGMLQRIAVLADGVADLSRLEGF
jgi:glycyl-tRNA synthetase